MKANERNLLIGLAGLALLAAFWLLILGPKRSEATSLDSKVGELKGQVAEQQQQIDFSRQAKAQFASNYTHVVALGKAVPEQSDTASFLVQLNTLAQQSGVDFRAFELDDSSAAPAAAPAQPGLGAAPPSTSQPSTTDPAPQGGQPASATTTSTTAAAPAAATEASASTVAIGASVGPAGLSALKYKLRFRGDFFQIADFMAAVDKLVGSGGGRVVVGGRLTTVDGFSLSADTGTGFPTLTASLVTTTYLTPPGQGLTAGASPSAPATTIPGQAPQLASSGTAGTP
jgi:Tfp pilus assembly protein PilO